MAKVVPTVLAASPAEYQAMWERARGLSRRVHVDITDGEFAPGRTIGLAQVNRDEEAELNLHLMVRNPVAQLETALSLKPALIIVHAEAEGDLASAMSQIRELGVRAGIALLPQTSPQDAALLIAQADHVLIFTGTLGQNNGRFQPEQLQKVSAIRVIKPEVEIGVDGGVTDGNAADIVAAGVDVLYSGGFLQGADDPQAAWGALQEQIQTGAAV